MIKILFTDIDWTNSDNEIIPMSELHELILPGRLIHNYTQPIITQDTFNGRTYPVQITIYDGYSIPFQMKEIGINDVNKILACKSIRVYDYETNVLIEVDTQANEFNLIEPNERLGTVDQSFNFTFVTKRTPTYPGIARLNTHSIVITINSVAYTYYTDIAPMSMISDPEKEEFNYNDGKTYVSKVTQKQGYRVVFYLMESQAVLLKRQIEQTKQTNITINGVVASEIPTATLTEMGEGLFKIEIIIFVENILNYPQNA